jgi:BTB/POZ domain
MSEVKVIKQLNLFEAFKSYILLKSFKFQENIPEDEMNQHEQSNSAKTFLLRESGGWIRDNELPNDTTNDQLLNQLEDESSNDCTLFAEDEAGFLSIKVNRRVLAAASPWWEEIHDFHNQKGLEIQFAGMTTKELLQIVEFFYRREVLIPEEEKSTFLEVLNFFKVGIPEQPATKTATEQEVLFEALELVQSLEDAKIDSTQQDAPPETHKSSKRVNRRLYEPKFKQGFC